MARNANSKPVTPDQRIRDLRKAFRGLEDAPPGPERATELAAFTRSAHAERQLNMAMHTAALCLADDPEAPTALVAAYDIDDEDPEVRLAALSDLHDLARYLDRADVAESAMELLRTGALDWVRAADEGERRYRLRTVQSLTSQRVADEIRDTLEHRR